MMMNVFNEFGSYGPNIILILSMFLLWDKNNMFFFYIIGLFIDFVLNLVLKGIIQQPRPSFDSKEIQLALKNNKRFVYKDGLPYDLFGMPSGHSSAVIFSSVFVFLVLRKTNWLYVYLLISVIVMTQRVVYKHHTIPQVLMGAFVGASLAYLLYSFAEKKVKGRIREKPDDYGPM